MGKLVQKKQRKQDALFDAAYQLFVQDGLTNTSISDITNLAGIAKGTFYLYFLDKEDIRDKLIIKITQELLFQAIAELEKTSYQSVEDRLVFIVDYVITKLKTKTNVLRFIEKNLSYGIFHQAIEQQETIIQTFHQAIFSYEKNVKDANTMLFLILELASSACFNSILHQQPMPFEQLQPVLYQSIKAIVKSFREPSFQ